MPKITKAKDDELPFKGITSKSWHRRKVIWCSKRVICIPRKVFLLQGNHKKIRCVISVLRFQIQDFSIQIIFQAILEV